MSAGGGEGRGAAKYGDLNFMTLAGDLQFYEALLNSSTETTQVRDGSFYIKFQCNSISGPPGSEMLADCVRFRGLSPVCECNLLAIDVCRVILPTLVNSVVRAKGLT